MRNLRLISPLGACILALSLSLAACGGGDSGSTPTAPTITTQPANQSVKAGEPATFSVVASGSATLTYQWKKNGNDITGATSSTYTTQPTSIGDSGTVFTVVIGNSAGTVTSSNASLAVLDAPAITTQPLAQTVDPGQTATFSVTATGTSLSYQWRKNGTDISGANSNTYTTPATNIGDQGAQFSVVVRNVQGNVTSNNAILTVRRSKTECVKDNITGLLWEGKNPSGSSSRLGSSTYTNYDSTTSAQKWNGSAYVNPTSSEINASTNSIGYVNSVNAGTGLCGYTDWRLPTQEELQGLVLSGTSPTIDAEWFPNTQAAPYWSSSRLGGEGDFALLVDFATGSNSNEDRGSPRAVRLVRSSK